MKHDPYPYFETLSQKQLGDLFGVSSRQVGRWLIEIGLRLPDGSPSPTARQAGLPVAVGDGPVSFFAWKKETVELLELAGYKRLDPSTGDPAQPLKGPFTTRPGTGDDFDLLNGDGTVGVRVRGQQNAEELLVIMNLAHKYGRL